MTPAQTAALHSSWKCALLPVALRAVESGEFSHVNVIQRTEMDRQEIARTIANYAATDMVMVGKTPLLPMDEVYAALPELAPVQRKVA